MTEIEILQLQNLLTHTSIISKKYDDLAKITGERFNIFSIMSMGSNEVYTHSAILGELLNPKGSHANGSAFVELFINELKQQKPATESGEFDFTKMIVSVEQHAGSINDDYTQGGYIDIVLDDGHKQIVIENKIYARDQPGQLIRYKNRYRGCCLLYLTLHGTKPSGNSADGLEDAKDYHTISYASFILLWLEKCHKEATEYPIVRETIKQYINLIKKLTNQSTNSLMKAEIRNLIDVNAVNTIDLLHSELNGIVVETEEKLLEVINTELTKMTIDLGNSAEVRIGIAIDGVIYVYFDHYINGKHTRQTEPILGNNLKLIANTIKLHKWHIGTYIPSLFINRNLGRFDRQEIVRIYHSEKEFKSVSDKILEDVRFIRNQFVENMNVR